MTRKGPIQSDQCGLDSGADESDASVASAFGCELDVEAMQDWHAAFVVHLYVVWPQCNHICRFFHMVCRVVSSGMVFHRTILVADNT